MRYTNVLIYIEVISYGNRGQILIKSKTREHWIANNQFGEQSPACPLGELSPYLLDKLKPHAGKGKTQGGRWGAFIPNH